MSYTIQCPHCAKPIILKYAPGDPALVAERGETAEPVTVEAPTAPTEDDLINKLCQGE